MSTNVEKHVSRVAFEQWMAVHAFPGITQEQAWDIWIASWNACYQIVVAVLSKPTEGEIWLKKRRGN